MLLSLLQTAEEAIAAGTVETLVPSRQEKFTTAYEAAKTVAEKLDATHEDVQMAYLGLLDAIWDFGYVKADKTALADILEQANAINPEECTPQTAENFTVAFEHAKKLALDAELSVADQPVIDSAVIILKQAMAALEKKPADKTELKELYTKYSKEKQTDYTPESWAKFAEALLHAKQVLENTAADEAEIKQAAERLTQAYNALEKTTPPASSDVPSASSAPSSAPNSTPSAGSSSSTQSAGSSSASQGQNETGGGQGTSPQSGVQKGGGIAAASKAGPAVSSSSKGQGSAVSSNPGSSQSQQGSSASGASNKPQSISDEETPLGNTETQKSSLPLIIAISFAGLLVLGAVAVVFIRLKKKNSH